MPRRRAKVFWADTPRLLRVLASPVRQELVDAAGAQAGPCSIADLAGALERPANTLYFHVRALERAGLFVPAGRRKSGRHAATLYRLPAPLVRLRYRAGNPANSRGIVAVVDGVLRLARRDFRRVMLTGLPIVEGSARDTWGGRVKGWLTPKDRRRLNACIEEIHALLRAGPRRTSARPAAFTFVCVPLDGGRPGAPSARRRRGKR